MKKSEQLQIYVLTHKIPSYGLPDDEYRTPIHCGKSLNSSFVCELGDDIGDNISYKIHGFLKIRGFIGFGRMMFILMLGISNTGDIWILNPIKSKNL